MTQRLTQTAPGSGLPDEVANLEQLITGLTGGSGTPEALMREHLEQARFYTLGAMPEEYHLTLRLAEQLLPEIHDQGSQNRIGAFLRSQRLDAG
jgi:hypothetical protein